MASAMLVSCQQHPNELSVDAFTDMAMEEEIIPVTQQSATAPPPPVNEMTTSVVVQKKIIKDGRMGLRVTELEQSKRQVDNLVKASGGYYANESLSNSDREISYQLKIRIPAPHFEAFVAKIERGAGEILYKQMDARDVTDQFVDLQIRLESKRNYLQRYRDLLKKAATVKEILEIEAQIRALEEEIDSTTGRLRYLSDQVDYSTLELTLSKEKDFEYSPSRRDRFSERLKLSLSKGWFGFVDSLLFLFRIWPFGVLVALGIYFWRKVKGRRRNV